MKREVIKFENGTIRRLNGEEVCHIDLIACEGEGIGFAGMDGSRELIADYFCGEGTLTEGRLWIQGQEFTGAGRREFERAGVFVISPDYAYMNSLDVSENIFLLRRNRLSKILLNDKALHIQGQHYIDRYGLSFRANEQSGNLEESDKVLIAMIRAITQGAKVLVLYDVGSCFLGATRGQLIQFIKKLKAEGICIVIVDNRADYVDNLYDQIVVFRQHTIVKKLMDVEEYAQVPVLLQMEMAGEKVDRAAKENKDARTQIALLEKQGEKWNSLFAVRKGEIVAALMEPGRAKVFWQSCMEPERHTQMMFLLDEQEIYAKDVSELVRKKIVFLECREHTEVCDNLSNTENILLPSYRRISNRFGFYRKQQRYIMQDTFLAEEQSAIASIWEESEGWRLAVYRWKLYHPKAIFLNQVLSDLNLKEREWLERELSEMAQRGTSVILLENDKDVCSRIADRIEVIV